MRLFIMKLSTFIFLLLLPCSSILAQQVEWLTPLEHDFGDIIHKDPVKIDFRYKNTSEAPMTIDNVRPSCGCTVPDWSYEPLAPDSTGTITILFDAKKTGYFRKKVKVYFSNVSKGQTLWIEGWVEEL